MQMKMVTSVWKLYAFYYIIDAFRIIMIEEKNICRSIAVKHLFLR